MKYEMSEHGAALQTYNQELVKCLESLKARKNEIMDIVYREEAERVVLEKNLKALEEKLNSLTQSLDHHKQMYDSYDKTIQETECGFKKILESSQALLHLAQHEVSKLENLGPGDISFRRNSLVNTFPYSQNNVTDY